MLDSSLMRPRGRPPRLKPRATNVWPLPPGFKQTEDALDFDRIDVLLGALLAHEWPQAHTLGNISQGEAISHFIASLNDSDKTLLLQDYLLLEVMLDEAGGPGVANLVCESLPPLEPSEPAIND